jgi:hypothetical protein
MNYIFTTMLIIAIAIGLIQSMEWNPTTALFPRVVGVPALGLCIAILITSVRKGTGQPKSEKAIQADSEFAKTVRTAAVLMSWIVGFIVLIWVVGINIAIPVYVFTYLKVQGKYGWLLSSITALCTGLFVFLVFNLTFRIVWPDSLIPSFF